MTDALVSIDGLTKRFAAEAAAALDRITATIKGGQITGLVGPDGAGKTTLIRLMAGLHAPDEGTLEVLGFDTPTEAAGDPGGDRLHAAALRPLRGPHRAGEPRPLCRSARPAEAERAGSLRASCWHFTDLEALHGRASPASSPAA